LKLFIDAKLMSEKATKSKETKTPPPPTSKVHLVFQEADVAVLNGAIELDETLQGEVIQIKDDYAVGPIENIFDAEGWQQRKQWWTNLLQQSPYNVELSDMIDDRMTVHNLKKRLDENEREEVWIWMGQNAHDVCGYYWLISQLKDYQGRVQVLYMNNLPFINEKGQLFYPTQLHEIQPKEFIKAKKLCRKVTLSEFEIDPDEWKRLAGENSMVRILEGGKKIASKGEDFYDADVLKGLTNEWQKGNKAMNSILSKMKIKTGDVFLLERMKRLAEEGRIEINGDTSKSWKDFEVKLKSAAPAEAPAEQPNM
jgi:hypothetical protein